MTVIDVAAVISAPLPAIYMATMFIVAAGLTKEPSQEFLIIMGALALASFLFWFVSGIYNLIGCSQGRKLALLGIVLNLVSLVAWIGLTLYRLLTVGAPNF